MKVTGQTRCEVSTAVQQRGSAGLSAAAQARDRACCGVAGSGVGVERHINRDVEAEEG